MINEKTMRELADIEITAVNKEDLVDVRGLIFDTSIPREQRAEQILCTQKNPYCFRYGEMGVKLEFSDSTRSLQDAFCDILERKKGGDD